MERFCTYKTLRSDSLSEYVYDVWDTRDYEFIFKALDFFEASAYVKALNAVHEATAS